MKHSGGGEAKWKESKERERTPERERESLPVRTLADGLMALEENELRVKDSLTHCLS